MIDSLFPSTVSPLAFGIFFGIIIMTMLLTLCRVCQELVGLKISFDCFREENMQLARKLKDVQRDNKMIFEQYDRFLKWNSMLDISYRTNGQICAFRYKGSHEIVFCRYNPQRNSLPLEVYDYNGLSTINERLFDAWLPCIGGVVPYGESTLPQSGVDLEYHEDWWHDTPSHEAFTLDSQDKRIFF